MESVRISFCDRCEAAIATLECTVCRQSDGMTRLALCQSCASVIHLGKARDHRTVAVEMKNPDALMTEINDIAKLREDLYQYRKKIGETTKGLAERFDINRNELCTHLKQLREHLSTVEQRLMKGLEDMHQEKRTYLVELMEGCDTDLSLLSALLLSSVKAQSSRDERDDLMKQVVAAYGQCREICVLQDQKKKVCSRLASPLCNPSCGFCPSFAMVYSALDSMTTSYPWSLACGQRYDVTAVGSLQATGVFTALLTPDASTQNVLDHISCAISTHLEEPSLPLPLVPGQLCCAKYKDTGDVS
ncbi:hypothetical protein EMCRGX_G021279 [Ephydatia muelleri]